MLTAFSGSGIVSGAEIKINQNSPWELAKMFSKVISQYVERGEMFY